MHSIYDIKAQWARQRPDLNTDPMVLIGQLSRVAAQLRREMEVTFAKHGLTAASFDVLGTLLRAGPPHALSPNQLLATMMVTSGTMTNRIDQLVKEGLVARQKNPEDGRSVLIALTETGYTKIDAAVTDHVATQARLVSGLSPERMAALQRHLDAFHDALASSG